MTKKVLFLDTVHPILEERLSELGYECHHDLSSSKEEVEEKIATYFGLVIRSRIPIDESFLNKASTLKFIARSGAGLENINTNYAATKGIKVFNSPEGNQTALGEHALGMLLMLFNQLKKGDQEVRQGVWNREANRGIEVAGKTVGIIGYGNMGSAFAKVLSGFNCEVIAYDKYKSDYSSEYVTAVDLKTIYEKTDILSIHLPLSDETHHYVNEDFLNQFEKPIYIINTARGNNVSITALVKGLKAGKILGACLDVLEYETKSFETIQEKDLPKDFNYLIQSEKVVLSPHVAGWTKESYIKLSAFLADKIEHAFDKC